MTWHTHEYWGIFHIRCPAYSGLPSFCTLVQDPSDACCMKPQCNLPGVSLTPYIGGGTSGSATPPTSLQVLPVGTHQTIIGYGPPTSGSGTRSKSCDLAFLQILLSKKHGKMLHVLMCYLFLNRLRFCY